MVLAEWATDAGKLVPMAAAAVTAHRHTRAKRACATRAYQRIVTISDFITNNNNRSGQ